MVRLELDFVPCCSPVDDHQLLEDGIAARALEHLPQGHWESFLRQYK